MSESFAAPPIMQGWMKKQSRSGIIKNWKSRYFVVGHGKIKYFEKLQSGQPEGLKGEMSLAGASLVGLEETGSNRVYVVGDNGTEKDLLMQADTSREANAWKSSIKMHIDFADDTR